MVVVVVVVVVVIVVMVAVVVVVVVVHVHVVVVAKTEIIPTKARYIQDRVQDVSRRGDSEVFRFNNPADHRCTFRNRPSRSIDRESASERRKK